MNISVAKQALTRIGMVSEPQIDHHFNSQKKSNKSWCGFSTTINITSAIKILRKSKYGNQTNKIFKICESTSKSFHKIDLALKTKNVLEI